MLLRAPYHTALQRSPHQYPLSIHSNRRTPIMLWTIFVIILILWLLGFTLHLGGGLIHILLVIALIVLIYNLITGRRGL